MKKKIKEIILVVLYPLSILINRINKRRGHVRVLMYHDIKESEFENFENQINNLRKKWNFITPEEFHLYKNGMLDISKNSILITFDDGFYSNIKAAMRILNKYNIKALFFIVYDFVNIEKIEEAHDFIKNNIKYKIDNNIDNKNWRNMRISDLINLINLGHSIGAHTMSHRRISELNMAEEITREIIISAEKLESALNISISDFAYTFGNLNSFSKAGIDTAKIKFKYIYTGLRGNNTRISSNLMIFRDPINPSDSNIKIETLLSGIVDPFYYNDINEYKRWINCEA
jgi:peptidoglycan/xylan/chitin deacetylase (PgdA/CDA1 family)